MTIVIISERFMGLALLLAAVCSLGILPALAADKMEVDEPADDLPARLKAIKDESRQLNAELLSEATKDLGEDIERTMNNQIDELLQGLDQQHSRRNLRESTSNPNRKRIVTLDEDKLRRLKESNRIVGEHIRDRIELVGDNSGRLPQMSLGATANSMFNAASQRLASASSYVGNSMRTLSASAVDKIPAKLKRFFQWPSFLQFKMRFHKRYPTLRTELYANFVFLKNQIVTSLSNIGFVTRRHSYILGQTQYSDMTFDEYAQTVGNSDGEEDLSELKTIASQAQIMAKLRRLNTAKSVHEEQLQQDGLTNPNKRARRSKRSAPGTTNYSDEEAMMETEDEDEEMTDDGAFGAGVDEMELEVASDFGAASSDSSDQTGGRNAQGDDFKVIDEYAAGADMTDLDDVSNDIDQALEPTRKFEPVDLRKTNCVPRAENQENCGICYAHVATASAAYHYCMENKRLVRLHARFVSDCGKYYGPTEVPPFWLKGCPGGRVTKAMRFIREVGVPNFHDYNWAQVSANIIRDGSDECAFPKPDDIRDPMQWPTRLKKSQYISNSRETFIESLDQVHLILKTVGPVVVNLLLWPKFKQYKGGVFAEIGPKSKGSYHSMLIVGHDYDSQGREIFILWNSHGTPWGEHGFMRITAEALKHHKVLLAASLPDTVV